MTRSSTVTAAAGSDIDAGLRTYMSHVYAWMTAGVGFTAAVTALVALNPALLQFAMGWPKWVAFIGVLALGWFAPKLIMTASTTTAQFAYWGYATLWGFLIAPMVAVYASQIGLSIIIEALLIATSVFAGASLFGYTTKKNLGAFATFFMMAAIGLLVAMLVNVFFVQSSLMALGVSSLVVLIFAGIAAWETQEIKNFYVAGDGAETAGRKAIMGAFLLYGSFVTIFIHVLRILGILSQE